MFFLVVAFLLATAMSRQWETFMNCFIIITGWVIRTWLNTLGIEQTTGFSVSASITAFIEQGCPEELMKEPGQ